MLVTCRQWLKDMFNDTSILIEHVNTYFFIDRKIICSKAFVFCHDLTRAKTLCEFSLVLQTTRITSLRMERLDIIHTIDDSCDRDRCVSRSVVFLQNCFCRKRCLCLFYNALTWERRRCHNIIDDPRGWELDVFYYLSDVSGVCQVNW
jgi:hypothetical protein